MEKSANRHEKRAASKRLQSVTHFGVRGKESQRWESNPQPPHYECGALPIEATLAIGPVVGNPKCRTCYVPRQRGQIQAKQSWRWFARLEVRKGRSFSLR